MDNKNKETLADYCRRIRNEKGLSTTKVQELSKKGGRKGITDGYISQIENNYIQNVSPEKLQALARGLGISEEEIFAVARGAKPDNSAIADERFARISKAWGKLPIKSRKILNPFLDAFENAIKLGGGEPNE